jgi:hypothetical protein
MERELPLANAHSLTEKRYLPRIAVSLDREGVKQALARSPDQVSTQPESGMTRALYDCPTVPLAPTGPEVRRARGHPCRHLSPPSVGVERDGTVYELLPRKRMGRCVAPPIVRSLHKSAEGSEMAPFGSCMPRASAIAAPVGCRSQCQESGSSVKPRRVSAVLENTIW